MGVRSWTCTAAVRFVVASTPLVTQAAIEPAHEPLTVLTYRRIIEPGDAELTQPEDFAPALQAEDSGLTIETITTVDSQCAGEALAAIDRRKAA